MANRKNAIQGIEPLSAPVVSNDVTVKVCRILNVSGGKLHLYFDGYGIQIDIPTGKRYSAGDTIKIGYNGTIGKSDFKKWIVD